jgi:hypothetical protein
MTNNKIKFVIIGIPSGLMLFTLIIGYVGFYKFIGYPHAKTVGVVETVFQHNHSQVISNYTVMDKKYTIQSTGNIQWILGQEVEIYYRIDDPQISTYRESDFDPLGPIKTAIGGVFFITFVFIVILFGKEKVKLGKGKGNLAPGELPNQ